MNYATSRLRYMHYQGRHYHMDYFANLRPKRTVAIRQWREDLHTNRFTWWQFN